MTSSRRRPRLRSPLSVTLTGHQRPPAAGRSSIGRIRPGQEPTNEPRPEGRGDRRDRRPHRRVPCDLRRRLPRHLGAPGWPSCAPSCATADATFKVVKNSLTERAADQVGAETLKELLAGPTALTFVRGDVATAAKAIADYGRATQLLPFKGGLMDGAALGRRADPLALPPALARSPLRPARRRRRLAGQRPRAHPERAHRRPRLGARPGARQEGVRRDPRRRAARRRAEAPAARGRGARRRAPRSPPRRSRREAEKPAAEERRGGAAAAEEPRRGARDHASLSRRAADEPAHEQTDEPGGRLRQRPSPSDDRDGRPAKEVRRRRAPTKED